MMTRLNEVIIHNKVVLADPRVEKQKQRQAKLAALAEKRQKGQLKLEDLFEQQRIIIEMLEELLTK